MTIRPHYPSRTPTNERLTRARRRFRPSVDRNTADSTATGSRGSTGSGHTGRGRRWSRRPWSERCVAACSPVGRDAASTPRDPLRGHGAACAAGAVSRYPGEFVDPYVSHHAVLEVSSDRREIRTVGPDHVSGHRSALCIAGPPSRSHLERPVPRRQIRHRGRLRPTASIRPGSARERLYSCVYSFYSSL